MIILVWVGVIVYFIRRPPSQKPIFHLERREFPN